MRFRQFPGKFLEITQSFTVNRPKRDFFLGFPEKKQIFLLLLAPTEVKREVLKLSFFVVAVFLWPNKGRNKNKYASGGDQTPPKGPSGGGG